MVHCHKPNECFDSLFESAYQNTDQRTSLIHRGLKVRTYETVKGYGLNPAAHYRKIRFSAEWLFHAMMVEELRTGPAILSCVMVSLSSVNVGFLFEVVGSFILMTLLYELYFINFATTGRAQFLLRSWLSFSCRWPEPGSHSHSVVRSYDLMLRLWYQKTAQSLVNKLLSLWGYNR